MCHHYEIPAEDLPPPALPTRGYLLDDHFVAEQLNDLEIQTTSTGTPLEEEDEYYTSMDPDQRQYENFGNKESSMEEKAYAPLLPSRHYANEPDEELYINHDVAGKRGDGYMTSSRRDRGEDDGESDDDDEYDYVLSNHVRVAVHRPGWGTGRK